jgi:hypothetical protein
MWTRRVAAPIAAVAVAALFSVGASQAAASGLSVSRAQKLAHKLELKQQRERSLVFTFVGDPVRRSSARIDFPYRDRSTADILCIAKIVVTQTGNSRSAKLQGAKCHGIPSEILNYEAVTRSLAHDVKVAGPDVRASLRKYDRAVANCSSVAVPKNRRKDVKLIFWAGGEQAFYGPLRTRLGDFETALKDVHGSDPGMTRGVEAWDRQLVLVDELPAAAADPCGAVKQWAANGFSDGTAPADFSELKVIRSQMKAQVKVLDETAAYFGEQGARPSAASAFSPTGLRAIVSGH